MAIQFKDVKQNYPVFIFDKHEMKIWQGKVLSVSFPRVDMNAKGYTPDMVIDITIESNGKTATYTIPESLTVTFAGNLVLATEKTVLAGEIEASVNAAKQILDSVQSAQNVVDKAPQLLAELNPTYKERQETERHFGNIEDSMSRLEQMIQNFINEFKS